MPDIGAERLAECASRVGYTFTDLSILRQALVHRSWQAENDETISNERLEFLGDAILGWAVADIAFHRLADKPEGKLTDLRRSVVNMHALADIARDLGIGEFLLLGRGEDAAGGREKVSILADAMEAIIGAVYLDGGAASAFELVRRLFVVPIEEAIPNLEMFDSKTRLQEMCARTGRSAPVYVTAGEGPDHERIFTAHVLVAGTEWGVGTGTTKKAAEQIAAMVAHDAIIDHDNA